MGASMKLREAATHVWATAAELLRRSRGSFTHLQHMREAVKLLRQHPGGSAITRPGRFITRWAQRFASKGNIYDAEGRGCKSKLTDEMAGKAVQLLTEGYIDNHGEPAHYVDINHALVLCKPLEEIRQQAGIKAATLWGRLQRYDPNLKRRLVTLKKRLTEEQKAARQEAAQVLVDKGPALSDYLKRTFWIDAKKLWVVGKRGRYIVYTKEPGKRRPMSHSMAGNQKKQDKVAIHYYAVVNYFKGPVMYVEVSGTTGLPRKYRVSYME